MLAVANYAMRGRMQASFLAVLGVIIPFFFWVSAAIIGLVTLRKGQQEGLQVLLWTGLPAAAIAALGDITPLITLLGILVLAAILRSTVSWTITLGSAALLGLLVSAVLNIWATDYLAIFQQYFAELLTNMQAQMASQGQQVDLVPPSVTDLAGGYGLMQAVTWVLCLLLARWWQARLYNPGGFQQEFHQLRLVPWQATLLAAVGLLLVLGRNEYWVWSWVMTVPFIFAGLGLVHCLFARRKLGSQWLGLFYIFLVWFAPLKHLVILLALIDSWLDLRKRLNWGAS